MDIQKYVNETYQTAMEHGWHDEKKSKEHWLMLIITEIAELIQADRENKHANREMFEYGLKIDPNDPDEAFKAWFDTHIKQSFEDELADICIRVFDFIGEFDIQVSMLDTIESHISPEFSKFSLTEQCFMVIGAITECEDMQMNCKNIILVAEHWAKLYGIDLEWHIKQKMRYNKLREWRHGNKKY